MATVVVPGRRHRSLTLVLLQQIALAGHGSNYGVGERLPSELRLAGELGVSRAVARDVLNDLESKQVIELRPGRGAIVRPFSDWNVLDLDVLLALMPTTSSVAVLGQYLECRRILEVEAAALAAERATGSDLTRMADSFAVMEATAISSQTDEDADRRFHNADIAFHGAIFTASGNFVLPRIVAPVQHAMAALRPQLALHPEHRARRTLPEHKAILAAISDRNSTAAREAMALHLATVEDYLYEYRVTQARESR